MKFTEIAYARPDIPACREEMYRITEAFCASKDDAAADAAFLRMHTLRARMQELHYFVLIHQVKDLTNAFYASESAYFGQNLPEIQGAVQEFFEAVLASPFRDFLARKYNRLFLVNVSLQNTTYSAEIADLLKREQALVIAYNQTIGKPITFDGKSMATYALIPYKQDADPQKRIAAWRAEGMFLAERGNQLDTIYTELTEIRCRIAEKLGLSGYTELAYRRLYRNCYTREDVAAYRESVKKHVVPLAKHVYEKQAERLGVPFPLSFADTEIAFPDGNAKCKLSGETLHQALYQLFRELSPETRACIDLLVDGGLMDTECRPNKRGGGFVCILPEHRVPFLFLNFNGTAGDVSLFSHEFGHAYAAYRARDVIPLESQSPSFEACEVHSMSMEMLIWPELSRFFDTENLKKFEYRQLVDALRILCYAAMVDEFQEYNYDHPALKPEERHELWKRLSTSYMPWIRMDGGVPFYDDGRGWQRQIHIYETPFYYLDYSLAQMTALQFWRGIPEHYEEMLSRYFRYTALAGTKTFLSLLDEAGLASPFDENTVTEICSALADWFQG